MPDHLTIGTYDGVHLGHQKIINAVVRGSRKRGFRSALIYFPSPPKFFFSGEEENCLITLPEEREELVRSMGVEKVRRMPFGSRLAAMGADAFFDSVVMKGGGAGGLCVGRDFAVGRDRTGDIDFLRRRCEAAGVRFQVMSFASCGGHKISSSLIRGFLRSGHVEEASKRLGRNYSVAGPVVRGAGEGRGLGFPTANLRVHRAKILPPGVFAVRARLGGKSFPGVANVGRRPTMRALKGRPLLEAHLFGLNRGIYGDRMEIEFLRHLRAERRFGSRGALRRQIAADVLAAKDHFSSCGAAR